MFVIYAGVQTKMIQNFLDICVVIINGSMEIMLVHCAYIANIQLEHDEIESWWGFP